MNRHTFLDATLIILGHGTTLNSESAAPVFQHAAKLRQERHFAEVREAFWKQSPRLADVLNSIQSARVFIVPLFMSEGYFSEQIIPAELGFRHEPEGKGGFTRRLHRSSQDLYYAKPVGTHDSMTSVVLDRAREIVKRFPFPRSPKCSETTLIIAGHGTPQNENSRKPIERQVALIRSLHEYESVAAVYMEEEPRIEQVYRLAPSRNVVVVPYFVSDGLHTQEDIPVLLGESKRIVQERLQRRQPTWRNPTEKHEKLVWYTSSVGTDSHIASVILERAAEAALWPLAGPATAGAC